MNNRVSKLSTLQRTSPDFIRSLDETLSAHVAAIDEDIEIIKDRIKEDVEVTKEDSKIIEKQVEVLMDDLSSLRN